MYRLSLALCVFLIGLSFGFSEDEKELREIDGLLENIVIPSFEVSEMPLRDVIKRIQWHSVQLDPKDEGINIVLRVDDEAKQVPISLKLSNVTLREVLRYTINLAQLYYEVDDHAVVVGQSVNKEMMFTNQYTVPPTFLIETEDAESLGRIHLKRTAKMVLEAAGVTFPPGSTAIYNPVTSTLIVKNFAGQMQLVEAYVTSLSEEVKVQIYLTVRIFTADESLIGAPSTNGGVSAFSERFERWEDVEDFLAGDVKAKIEQNMMAICMNERVYSEWEDSLADLYGFQFTKPNPIIVRSGESAIFSADGIALGVEAVLGPDDRAVDMQLLPRDFEGPVLASERTTVWDGHTVVIGGQLVGGKHVAIGVRPLLQDPAGLPINAPVARLIGE